MRKRNKQQQKEYKLFEESMYNFSDLAEMVLKYLKPFEYHGRMGTCSTGCPTCRVKDCYWKVKNMVTEWPPK